jgi:hypothetical protein
VFGGLGIDGVLEGLWVEVQWGAGWLRGGVLAEELPFLFGAIALVLVAELWDVLSLWFTIPVVYPVAWTMLLLWPERWDDSMVWTMCLSMLAPMIHLCLLLRHIYGPHSTWYLNTCTELSLG